MDTSTSGLTTLTSADTSPRPERRWPIVVAAVALQLCLGSVYAWSVFRTPLAQGYGWSYQETAAPFRFFLFAYSFGIWIGGGLLDRLGPRAVARAGGLLLLAGLALASTRRDPLGLALAYGLLGGLGAGMAYPTPVATLIRWFPDRKGLMGGVGVFGFGAGSLVFAPVLAAALAGTPEQQALRLPTTFLALGLVFVAVAWLAGGLLRWPEQARAGEPVEAWGTRPWETWRTWPYPALWLCFLCATSVGLAAINEASPLLERLGATGGVWLAPSVGVGLMAVANGAGRLVWGQAADRIGRRAAMIAMFSVMAASAALYAASRSQPAALAALVGIGLCFGGMLGMLPSNVSGFFGTRAFGANYGMSYSAFALSAWMAPAVVSFSVQEALAGAGSTLAAHEPGGWMMLAASLAGLAAACTLRGGARRGAR
ncbi:MAG: MFS transporter [Fimbriimonadales bacterium]|nr:MFS transporter [Fimbriimonadales bacterium]